MFVECKAAESGLLAALALVPDFDGLKRSSQYFGHTGLAEEVADLYLVESLWARSFRCGLRCASDAHPGMPVGNGSGRECVTSTRFDVRLGTMPVHSPRDAGNKKDDSGVRIRCAPSTSAKS